MLRSGNKDDEDTAADEFRRRLEQQYLDFPTSLLKFESAVHAYQAEAMVWLHGIFIVSCMIANRNLLHQSSSDVL